MISVIIPTRNRAELLSATLTSISGQTLSSDLFEVLVVDNGSTDETRAVTLKFQENVSNCRYIFAPVPGLHEGRHKGMREAQYDVLVFADDDIEAKPDWLLSYYEVFQDPLVAMAGGNNYPLYASDPPPWLTRLWNNSEKFDIKQIPQLSVIEKKGSIQNHDPQLVWGCNFAIRKKILLNAGGFHPDGMPTNLLHYRGDGETHVSNYVEQKGLKCIFHPDASVYHKVSNERMTIKYFYDRGFNQGISYSFSKIRCSILSKNKFSRFSAAKHFIHPFFILLKFLLSFKIATGLYGIGWFRGYCFHQKLYDRDEDLQQWVSKKDYLS